MNTVEIILELLKQQNKQQKELTQYLGISEGTVAEWKKGKTKSYKKHIEKIAEFFNVSVDYLLERTELASNTITNNGTNIGVQANIINNENNEYDINERKLIEKFRLLNYEEQINVIANIIEQTKK